MSVKIWRISSLLQCINFNNNTITLDFKHLNKSLRSLSNSNFDLCLTFSACAQSKWLVTEHIIDLFMLRKV